MAAWNAEKYIREAIDSVLVQSYTNWELLLVNDGSTDATDDIVRQYGDPRIIYLKQNKSGVSGARNNGLLNMKGDFFCFLDADDILPPESLESRLNLLLENPELTFADGHVRIHNENLSKEIVVWKPNFKGNPVRELLSISGKCFFGPTWMVRRNKNRAYRFYETLTHGEDLMFYIELAMEGGLYDYVQSDILIYRKGHISAMKDLNGLEEGYRNIFSLLCEKDGISKKQSITFKESARSIIFRSYLGHYKPFQAVSSLLKKWNC